jgi:hypothetical protein
MLDLEMPDDGGVRAICHVTPAFPVIASVFDSKPVPTLSPGGGSSLNICAHRLSIG